MTLTEIIFLGIALSLDTFAVALSISVCSGSYRSALKYRYISIVALFHFLMPVIGWACGSALHNLLSQYDHWIAFFLLLFLGVKMIREAFSDEEEGGDLDFTSLLSTLMFATALSIDAIVTGLSFSFSGVEIIAASQFWNVILASIIVGLFAFLITWLGFMLGNILSSRIGRRAPLIGGCVLIILGIKILWSHLAL